MNLIELFKLDDTCNVLIFWDNNAVNVIPMSDVEKLDIYEIDQRIKNK
jgi:hypothetical protein